MIGVNNANGFLPSVKASRVSAGQMLSRLKNNRAGARGGSLFQPLSINLLARLPAAAIESVNSGNPA